MGSNTSSAISILEQAASTKEMANAANQIVAMGVTNYTLEQLNHLIRALSAAARWATDGASVVAWARVIVTAGTTQATKDAFATPAIVSAFVQLAQHATTPESVQQLTSAISVITAGTTQATSDAFATPAIVSAFAQLAQHATTPESVQQLTSAISLIAAGTTQATKDAFAIPAIVSAFAQLAQHATTPESVQQLTVAIGVIAAGTTQATKDAFATPAIVSAFVQLAQHATTPESVVLLTCAISAITAGTTQATKDAFATPAIVSAFAQLAQHATTPESVQLLTGAVTNITAGTTEVTLDAFATPAIVSAFAQLAQHATTPESVGLLTCGLRRPGGGDQLHRRRDDASHKRRVCDPCNRVCLRAAGSTRNDTGVCWISDVCDQPHRRRDDASHERRVRDPCDCVCLRAAGSTRNDTGVCSAADKCDQRHHRRDDASHFRRVCDPCDCVCLRAAGSTRNDTGVCSAADKCDHQHHRRDDGSHKRRVCDPSDCCSAELIFCRFDECLKFCVGCRSCAMATNRLANLRPPAATGGPCCLDLDFTIAIAAYTYDLGFSLTNPTGAGSDNFYCCLNAALHQRAHDGTGLLQLKPILYFLFRGLAALPIVALYRGVPSSTTAVVREKYLSSVTRMRWVRKVLAMSLVLAYVVFVYWLGGCEREPTSQCNQPFSPFSTVRI